MLDVVATKRKPEDASEWRRAYTRQRRKTGEVDIEKREVEIPNLFINLIHSPHGSSFSFFHPQCCMRRKCIYFRRGLVDTNGKCDTSTLLRARCSFGQQRRI